METKILLLALAVLVQLCSGSGANNFTSKRNITILRLPTHDQDKLQTQCQLRMTREDGNVTEDFCEKNVPDLFGDIISLATNNSNLNRACQYELDCSEPSCGPQQTGKLCRTCEANYSRTFHTDACKQCSNLYLLLILPFAVAGILLIVFILKCNLSVSTGQINAIIFYANMLHVYKRIQFQNFQRELVFFSVFISWLNLDLGIETCFYDGMDAITRVWLQFVFPAYLWLLVGLLGILQIFRPIRKLLGGNCVPVLSVTVIIITYSKILQTIKSALTFSFSWQEDSRTPLWREDDTVPYLGHRHKPLFIVAILVALLYILPLTLLGVFAPCIQTHSHRKALRWVRKLNPFLNAYQAPYNDNFRSWTGLMLVIRVIIYIFFSTNHFEDPPLYYFIIVTIVGPLSVFVAVKRNKTVYRRIFSNALEALSLINLTLLNLVSWFLSSTIYTKGLPYKHYFTYASIALTMVLFVLVLLYQISLMLCPQIHLKCQRRRYARDEDTEDSSDGEIEVEVIRTNLEFDCSQKNSLKEPLIESSATPLPAPIPTPVPTPVPAPRTNAPPTAILY